MNKERPLKLVWTANWRDRSTHYEWTAPCGCAYHPEPQPHVHQCSTHKPADTLESMQARITELEAENKRMKSQLDEFVYVEDNPGYVSAADKLQARIELLEKALQGWMIDHGDRCRVCMARSQAALKGQT